MALSTTLSKTHFKGPLINGGNLTVTTVDPTLTPTAIVVSTTLVVADYNAIKTNTAASATIILTLPAANTVANKMLKIQSTAAQIIQLAPASGEIIWLGGSGTADQKLNIAAVIGNYADIYCDGVAHMVVGYAGVLTKV